MDQKSRFRSYATVGRPVIDPAAWTGKALEADTSWIIELDHGALDDLKYLADQLRPKIEGNPTHFSISREMTCRSDDLPAFWIACVTC